MQATILQGGKTSPATALRALRLAPSVDCVYLQKKLLPSWYLPFLRRAARRIVFDFDDALYAPRSRARPEQRRLARRLKAKLDRMLDTVDLAVAGNEILADYARRHLSQVVVVPTTYLAAGIDAKHHASRDPTIIGWIGSQGTLVYLEDFVPVLKTLSRRFDSRILLRVVSNAPFSAPGLEGLVQNVRWSLDKEVDLIFSLDIGVMPLLDDDWSRGKCAFKAIQMMTCGLPVVASPVGANNEVIQDGVNGYLAADANTWVERLAELVESPGRRQTLGEKGRATVEARYSADRWAGELWSALDDTCERPSRGGYR